MANQSLIVTSRRVHVELVGSMIMTDNAVERCRLSGNQQVQRQPAFIRRITKSGDAIWVKPSPCPVSERLVRQKFSA